MTGRGQGVCGNRNTAGAGGVYGGGFGGRGCGRGFGGGGRGMGRGMGRGFGPAAAPAVGAGVTSEAVLQDRARMLEQELNAIKAQLDTLSDDK